MLATLSACGGKEASISKSKNVASVSDSNSDANSDGTKGDNADDTITLDWYINYSWYNTSWGQNLVSQTITDNTGINIDFVTPVGSEEEKLNALIASDSLPDLITLGWWEPQIEKMISEGMVYPLNELSTQYGTDFFDVAEESVINWYKQEDGNIYCYPNSSYNPQDVEKYDIPSNVTFLVRKDMYEAIGSPDMSTKEGFYNAIVEASKKFPEVNGEKMIPIGGTCFDDIGCASFDQYLQDFLAVKYEEDGIFYDRNTDPEYLSWVKLLRQLNEEGYISPDIFVDQRVQVSEKIAEGRYFSLIYQRTDLADQQKILFANDPNSIYMAVDGPRNENHDDPVLPTTGINGWTVTLISKNCKEPEKAIRFLEYLMSEEGQKILSAGIEGVTYDMVDGKAVLKEDFEAILNSDREEYDRLYGADDTYWMMQNNVMQMQWMPSLEEPLAQLAEWTYPYASYKGQYDVMMVESTNIGETYSKVKRLWSATLKQLIMAESDEEFDSILNDYLIKRDELGYKEVLEEETRQMHQNKKRLGFE